MAPNLSLMDAELMHAEEKVIEGNSYFYYECVPLTTNLTVLWMTPPTFQYMAM